MCRDFFVRAFLFLDRYFCGFMSSKCLITDHLTSKLLYIVMICNVLRIFDLQHSRKKTPEYVKNYHADCIF